MNTVEIGHKLVAMVNAGREAEADFVTQFFADDVVSIEGQGTEDMPARMQGIDAIRGKHDWWYANNDVHSSQAEGPYVGHREDQFIVKFQIDVTPTGGERMQMEEMGLFTVKDGKICTEEFLYRIT